MDGLRGKSECGALQARTGAEKSELEIVESAGKSKHCQASEWYLAAV